MSEPFYGIKPGEMPNKVLMHYQSIELDELPAEIQDSIIAMIEVFRSLHHQEPFAFEAAIKYVAAIIEHRYYPSANRQQDKGVGDEAI